MRGSKVEFTAGQIKEMVALFNQGASTQRIGELQGHSATAVQRALRERLGNLRAARMRAHISRSMTALSQKHLGGRERFEAGYRMALTHVHLHGLQRTRDYCDHALLPWREAGLEYPPEFLKIYRGR